MKVALRGSYLDFVIFMGVNEKYPQWFQHELEHTIYTDESRRTLYVSLEERRPDYYEKTLVEDYSVFLRKPNGSIFVTNYEVFIDLYIAFTTDVFTNSGICAFEEDCIEYVECQGGSTLNPGYPAWFYEYFTEAVNLAPDHDSMMFKNNEFILFHGEGSSGDVTVTEHCVFLRNKHGAIRSMEYDKFLKYYDPEPIEGKYHYYD